uniref:Ycf1 n=1 Tax=Caulerpa cliftonii TaxID=1004391 RepID=A0A1C9JBV8_9CHLO|nr:hypothetical protein [Caulerpa cliftonii]AOP19322.1 hypothetical protein [Caulerpa cliftonii]
MSIILPIGEFIKNTNDVLNKVYEFPTHQAIGAVIKYFWNYLSTFKWIDYYAHFGLVLPKNTHSVFKDLINAPTPNLNLLLQTNTNVLSPLINGLNGFLNSFFLYLPISPVQFIWLRSVVIEGIWAAGAATFGLILGNLSFLGCCLFGLREIIYFWFGFEPLSYFLGVSLVFIVIFQITQRSRLVGPFRILKKSQKDFFNQLFQLFLINFALVWTDQSSLLPFLSNLCFQSGTNILDYDFDSNSIFYFEGILLGSFFWTFILGLFFTRLGNFLTRFTPFSYWIRGFHNFCLVGCLTLTLTSFGYYGIDYLFANPLGFVSVYEKSLFKTETPDAPAGRLGRFGAKSSMDTDLSLFDRARFGSGPSVELNFESLNYQEEYMWRTRVDRLSSRSVRKGKGILNKFLVARLGPAEEARQKERRRKKQDQQFHKFQKIQQKKKNQLSKSTNQPSKFEYTSPRFSLKEVNKDANVFSLDSYALKEDLFVEASALLERFLYDYLTKPGETKDPDVPDLPNYKMVHFSAFSEIMKFGFDIFSFFSTDIKSYADEDPIEYEMKEKYSENYIYRFLVNFDISNFLQGLPKHHRLTSQEEIELFKKRLALSEYLDSFRIYSKLNSYIGLVFQPLFCGPKSYSNRVYNQQFKGTLKIVERLFSIHLEDHQNIPTVETEEDSTPEEYKDLYLKIKKDPSVLKFDQPLYNSTKSTFPEARPSHISPLAHHLISIKKNSIKKKKKKKKINNKTYRKKLFVQETNPVPFFVAWNRKQRKFVVTNRLLTRRKTLDEFRFSREIESFFKKWNLKKTTQFKSSIKLVKRTWNPELSKFDEEFEKESKVYKTIRPLFFTTWPVKKKVLLKNPTLTRLYRTSKDMQSTNLFIYIEPEMLEEDIIYDKLPSIVDRITLSSQTKLQTSLAPRRGILVWPGPQPSLKIQQEKK